MQGRAGTTAAPDAPPYGWSVLVGGAVLALYIATLAPSTGFWDASEYIAAARVLGVPHPPGNPLFVLLAHAFGTIPLPVAYAVRINLLAALSTAVATAVWFLLVDHVLARRQVPRWWRRAFAAAGVVCGATAFTVWNQSTVNEKVYTICLALYGVITWLLIGWLERSHRNGNDWRLALIGLLLGLGYCVHPAGLLPAPGVIVAVVARDWRRFLRPRLVFAVFGAFALGLTPFAFEPIRAAQFPPIDEGAPTGCMTRLALSCTLSEATYTRLAANINRTQYGKPSVLDRQVSFATQMGMWWLYFRWQWLRDPHGAAPAVQLMAALVFLGLGIAGTIAHWRWDRDSFWYWAPFVFTLSVLLVFYMNFKYGYSQSPQLGDSVPREVRDRDYFYLWSYSAWSVWVALGMAAVWLRVRAGAALMALAAVPLVANWRAASRHGDTIARDWAVDLLQSAEPYGIIVTNGDNDTFPLWYAQYVEGVRPDVTVAITTYLDLDWFDRQLIRTRLPHYDADRGPSIYRGRPWPYPSAPTLNLSYAESDAIPDLTALQTPQLFSAHDIEAVVPAGYLSRGELVLLRIIADDFPARAIYFTAGNPMPAALGLTPYLVRTGLLRRLVSDRAAGDTTRRIDLARSLALWKLYRAPEAITRVGDWVDRASAQPPVNYAILGDWLASALAARGDSAGAARIEARVAPMLRAARFIP